MRIILSWKGIEIGWQTSKLISIDDDMQLTGPANDVENHMEAHPITIKGQEDIGHRSLGFWKMMRGKLLQIFPIPS
jgi:hypothetical protein